MDKKHDRRGSTGTYRVRGVSRDLHRAARLRAAREGTTLRWVVLEALQAYSTGTWTPSDEPPGSRTNGISGTAAGSVRVRGGNVIPGGEDQGDA